MNSCGDCQACCEVLAVEGLKERSTKCKNQCATGCSIYKTRPKGCSHFKCAWLTSGWKQEYRPDISGIMVATYEDKIMVHRLSDNVNKNLFDRLIKLNVPGKEVCGVDSRVIGN